MATDARSIVETADLLQARRGRVSSALLLQVGMLLATITLLLAMGILFSSAAVAIAWYNQPFLGILTNHVGVISPVNSFTEQPWIGFRSNLQVGDRVIAVSYNDPTGVMVFRLEDTPNRGALLNQMLAGRRPAQEVTVEVFRTGTFRMPVEGCTNYTASGATCSTTYRLSQMPLLDFAAQFGVGFAVALVCCAIGIFVWFTHRRQFVGQLIIVFCALGAVSVAGRFDALTTYHLGLVWLIAMCGVGAVLTQIGIEFPYPLLSIQRRAWLRYGVLLIPLLLFTAGVGIYTLDANLAWYDSIQIAGSLAASIGGVLVAAFMLVRYRRTVSPVLREKAALVLIGLVFAIAPAILWFALTIAERIFGWTGVSFSPVLVLPLLLAIPITLVYAQTSNSISSDRIISEALIYTILGGALVIGYLLITTAVYILTAGVTRSDNPVMIAITLFVIAVLFTPARLRLEKIIDAAFFRQRRQYDQRLEAFSRALTATIDVDEVTRAVQREIASALAPQYCHIFLRNYPSNDYEALPDEQRGKSTTNVRFRPESDLVALFSGDTSILRLDIGETPPIKVAAERARLAILNTPVLVRLRSARRLNGFLALGSRQSKQDYNFEETRYLESLATQAAAAYERAQIILEAQRNERELKVLSQASAALNIVMDFDTLLEFVYTQVNKVIPTENFYIAFRDEHKDELYFAFYQESGERLDAMEGQRWTLGRDLFSEVVRTQQPFKTDNFVVETQRRDPRLRIDNAALRGWIGVPLNAGEGLNLGCIALATTDPSISYSTDQMRIFWDIASLAATALYKTRLYTETEVRGRQMKALNDISSRLASAFENVDELLNIITESAVEILNCQAGSLLLRDENTDELVFMLAIGGGGDELVGTRIPLNSGIAGAAASSGRPMIVNDAQQDKRWFGEVGRGTALGSASMETGARPFTSMSILAVPLTARGAVIGVIELVNKRDASTFNDQDVELLTTFASQAAVAIENARLYRSTDEQLAIRVQQLDTMQRIDQELNRTLDLQRVIDLTVENAVREGIADAGALALAYPETSRFLIAGSMNYPDDIMQPGSSLDLVEGTPGRVYQTGHPWLLQGDAMIEEAAILPGAQSQLAVPLITGQQVGAVLLLESKRTEAFNITTLSQIQALAEHANTAITNAQLYTQLEDANQARAKFVGFVAHELKNPMASIKGYSEVLLGGLTGQLNEQQQNFIAVIRRNVVRMQQLVDDLRDLVAQESGNLTLRFAPVNFNNVIVETLRPQQRAVDEKEQEVHINAAENLPLVWGDELRLIQIMTNFISNANKYTPNGGTITLTADATMNIWDPNAPSEVLYCTISDTGIGMDDVDLSKLFTPYWRSENPRAREQPGTGLGMTLTRGLIEAHQGKLWVESRLNVGTTFHFYIPLASTVETISAE